MEPNEREVIRMEARRETNVSLSDMLDRIEADPKLGVAFPFPALAYKIVVGAGEAGTFDVHIFNKDHELVGRDLALSRERVTNLMTKTKALEERRVILLGEIMAVQAQMFLAKEAQQ